MKYERDFEVGDMVVVTNVEEASWPHNQGDLGFVEDLDDENGIAYLVIDTSVRNMLSQVLYEEIEKFNPEKDYS
jgi:hypothetical protein